MDWNTGEDRLDRIARLLILVSSLIGVIASLIYLLLVILPIYYFHGYVYGYYSVTDYKLYYSYNNQPISMPHTDYIRHVSLIFALSSASLLVISIASAVLFKRKPLLALGLSYGVSMGLIMLYGLFNGYIYRAVSLDVGGFSNLIGDEKSFSTLAGVVTFEGVRIEETSILRIGGSNWIQLILIIIAFTTSFTSLIIVSRKIAENKPSNIEKPRSTSFRNKMSLATLIILVLPVLASVFVYNPATLTIAPSPPTATLETPPYNYTCTALNRVSRGALTYTDFETYPLTGWASSGGTWSSVSGVAGAKGNVLQGTDNNGGLGAASHYYYNTPVSGNNWVAVKTRWVSGSGWYGISMMNSGINRMYTVEISTTEYLEIWSYNVVVSGWRSHARVSIPGYSQTSWYTIVVSYSVAGTTITITAYLYSASGSYVTSVSATITSANVFTPAYIGVEVDGVAAYFDEFIISTVDPRTVYFTSFYTGMSVEVWDNLGSLVNTTKAPASSFTLGVVNDIVVGTGVDGRIVVRYPDSYLCVILTVPATDAILGGDTYNLSTAPITVSLGANKTSASLALKISGASQLTTTSRVLSINTSQTLYARLIIESLQAPTTLNLDIWLEGVGSSTSITIRNGSLITSSTNVIQLNLGSGNSISVSGYFTTTGQTATLTLKLELCTLPGSAGVCVYYPIFISLSS